MIVKLKGIMTADGDSLESFVPNDVDCFSLWIEASFGLPESEGADQFTFQIVTPNWLGQNCKHDEAVLLRHKILVKEWNPNLIKNRLEKLGSSVSGSTWEQVVSKLSRYGYWEFEDCQEISE